MSAILAIAFTVMIFSLFVQFARHEFIVEYYEDIVIDVEGRLEWAHTLTTCPFGMASQLDVCKKRLDKAKDLWQHNHWRKAYEVALKAQEAMDKAQDLYKSKYVIPGNKTRTS